MHQRWNRSFQPSARENLQNDYDDDFGFRGRYQPAMRNTVPWYPRSVLPQVPFNCPDRSLSYHPRFNYGNSDFYGLPPNLSYDNFAAYQSFQRSRFQMYSESDYRGSNVNKFIGREILLEESRLLESRGFSRERNSPAVVRSREFGNLEQLNHNQSNRERMLLCNQEQFPAPVLNNCATEVFRLSDAMPTESQQNVHYNVNVMEGEDANDGFCSDDVSNAALRNGGNVTTDQSRQTLYTSFGDSIELVDDDSIEIIKEVLVSSQLVNHVSVIRHTCSLSQSDHEAQNSPIVNERTDCCESSAPELMDCNNNSEDKSMDSSNIQDIQKNAVLPLKGTIINWNFLKHFQNFTLGESQRVRSFYELNNFKIAQNCAASCNIYKKGNMEKCNDVLSVLVYPFYTFHISIDIYFLFLNICTHFHIFFSGLRSCLTYITLISNLCHFLLEDKAKYTDDRKLCLGKQSKKKFFEFVKLGCFPPKIYSVLPDKRFQESKQLLIKNNLLYFRKGHDDTFIPLKICGELPQALQEAKLDKMEVPKALYAKNGSSIPIVLLKKQICGTSSVITGNEILFEICQSLKNCFLIENSVKGRVVREQTDCNDPQSRSRGEHDFGYSKKEKVKRIPDTKIGMYVVKPISIRRAQCSKKLNKNLFSVRPTWVNSDLKLFFEQLDSDNENFVNRSKYGIFEINPIMNCLENSPHVKGEPYTVKYLMPDEHIKILFVKDQNSKSNKKTRNRVNFISNENHYLVKELDDLSNNDKKKTLLLKKKNNGYENVGQEPIQIILEKLGIHGYPFLIDEMLECSDTALEPSKTLACLPNLKKGRLISEVEPMSSICLDMTNILNSSSGAQSLLDTCDKLAETFIKHRITLKQNFGCVRKIFSDSEQEDLLKVMCEKGELNVYEAVQKYLNLNFTGIGEFKNCMGFRQVRGVRSVLAQGNITRSDDDLFLFYEMPMLDGQSHLSLQVVIKRRLPNEPQCVNSTEMHLKSEEEIYLVDQSTNFKVLKGEFSSPNRQQVSEEMELELELELERELQIIHGEAPSQNNLLLQNMHESTYDGASLDFLSKTVEENQLNSLRIGSDIKEEKVFKDTSTYNQLDVQVQLTKCALNEIVKNENQDETHIMEVETGPEINQFISSALKNNDRSHKIDNNNFPNIPQNTQDDVKSHHSSLVEEACQLQLDECTSDAFPNNTMSKPSRPMFRDRSTSPPPKKPRHGSGDRESPKLSKTITIKQYIERNPLKETEASDICHRSENVTLVSKNNSVHSPSHIVKKSPKLDKSNVYYRNQQSLKCQYYSESQNLDEGLKDRKLFHLENSGVHLQHQPSSHFSQRSPSFENRNLCKSSRQRRCSESDSLQTAHANRHRLGSQESIPSSSNETTICRYCDNTLNKHCPRDGLYKCPKITKNSIRMYQERTWKKSFNSRNSSDHAVAKQNNSRVHADCFVKEQSHIRIYTDPECFEDIVASTLTREDEDALQRVVTEGDIFLYSPEKKSLPQDPRSRKNTHIIDSHDSNDNKKVIAPINTKCSKPTVASVPAHDMKPIIMYDEMNSKDPSIDSVMAHNDKPAMKFREKCLDFLNNQAQYFYDNPDAQFDAYPFAQISPKNNKILAIENCGNDQQVLTDSNVTLEVQQAPSPELRTSTQTPFSAIMPICQNDESSNPLKKGNRKDEPYSPGSPTSTISNYNDQSWILKHERQ